MTKKRRQYSATFKFQVAMEAVKGDKTINQLASEHGVHPNQISEWKRLLLEKGNTLFSRQAAQQERARAEHEADVYEQLGRLQMELAWLKKTV